MSLLLSQVKIEQLEQGAVFIRLAVLAGACACGCLEIGFGDIPLALHPFPENPLSTWNELRQYIFIEPVCHKMRFCPAQKIAY